MNKMSGLGYICTDRLVLCTLELNLRTLQTNTKVQEQDQDVSGLTLWAGVFAKCKTKG